MLALWIAGLLAAGYAFFIRATPASSLCAFGKGDAYIVLALMAVFAPLYLLRLHSVPFQINTDEISIMVKMQQYVSADQPDLFGLSDYFHFPTLIFVLLGWLGEALGGITLHHMRFIHALFGLAIIAVSYLFFRAISNERLFAAGAALLVGCNHALLAISRMAMRDNLALLIEIGALALLFCGLRRRSYFATYLGGVLAGFGFYNYFPARITLGPVHIKPSKRRWKRA